jgi:hypothetical protein
MTEVVPQRFMLDSNVYDALIVDPVAEWRLRERVAAGVTVILSTHVQQDELARAPEPKRSRLLSIPAVIVSTNGIVFDESRLDSSRFTVDGRVEFFRTRGWGAMKDALIGATAQYEDAMLVTDDADLRKRAAARGVQVCPTDWFLNFVRRCG